LAPPRCLGEPLRKIKRARPPHIVLQIFVHLVLELRIDPRRRGRLPPARGSGASASRRRNARHRGRNGRFRPVRCGRNWGSGRSRWHVLHIRPPARAEKPSVEPPRARRR
jgi:hypothetical protein